MDSRLEVQQGAPQRHSPNLIAGDELRGSDVLYPDWHTICTRSDEPTSDQISSSAETGNYRVLVNIESYGDIPLFPIAATSTTMPLTLSEASPLQCCTNLF